MLQCIAGLHSNTGKRCISDTSISTHPLDTGCTAHACHSEVANIHSCHNAHLVVVVRVLGYSVSSEVVESRMMVGQLWVLACWLASNYGRVPGWIFWEALVSPSVGHNPSCRPARKLRCTGQGCIQTEECTKGLPWLGFSPGVPACRNDQGLL